MVFYIVKKKKVFTSICSQISQLLSKNQGVLSKKKKGLHLHLLSNFRIFVQKLRCSLKRSVVTSLPLETNAK